MGIKENIPAEKGSVLARDGGRNLREGFFGIVGKCRQMQDVFRRIEKVAATNATVLIVGESGTGKELVAKAIHDCSRRKNGPFITLTCSSIPESLLATELFGHEKGAFTGAHIRKFGKFEAANHGTLFLDDVADVGPAVQASLLRFLQTREFERVGGTATLKSDARVIAATNRDLYREVQAQRFREDLYYRLNVIPIFLPPLRERKEDIPLLAEYFMQKYARDTQKNLSGLMPETMLLLLNYSWPGNVRELEHVIERAVIMADGEWIDSTHFFPNLSLDGSFSRERPLGSNLRLSENIRYLEKYLITQALREANGKKMRAAELLGITYRALRYKMKKLGYP